MHKVKVISISGNSGAGKTTLTRALAQIFFATAIFWDDFDSISTSPENYVDWFHRGENYSEWDYPGLANVLKTLKSNQHIIHPVFNRLLTPTSFIFFDTGNSRLHHQTGQFIDFAIHIDLPLDISLSRRVIRDFKNSDQTKIHLIEELEYYLSHSRPLFIDDNIKAASDSIIDGRVSTEQQVCEIKRYLNSIEKI